MYKKLVIGIIIIILIISFGGYALFKNTTQGSLTCVKAGFTSSNPSLGPDDQKNNCCQGLIEISADLIYEPEIEFADENGCVFGEGFGTICSNCGNNNCEEWENPCNCPADCSR